MSDDAPQEPVPWILTNQSAGIVLSAVLLVLFGTVYWSDWAFEIQPDGFILGFFPLLGIIWMLICTAMIVFDHSRREMFGDFHEVGLGSWVWVSGLILSWFAYMILVIQVGFFAVTFLYMSALYRLAGEKSWRSVAVTSAICVAVVFSLFFVIGITLPMGKIWS